MRCFLLDAINLSLFFALSLSRPSSYYFSILMIAPRPRSILQPVFISRCGFLNSSTVIKIKIKCMRPHKVEAAKEFHKEISGWCEMSSCKLVWLGMARNEYDKIKISEKKASKNECMNLFCCCCSITLSYCIRDGHVLIEKKTSRRKREIHESWNRCSIRLWISVRHLNAYSVSFFSSPLFLKDVGFCSFMFWCVVSILKELRLIPAPLVRSTWIQSFESTQ